MIVNLWMSWISTLDKKKTKPPRKPQKKQQWMLHIEMSTKGGPGFTFSLPGGRFASIPPVNYATVCKPATSRWLRYFCQLYSVFYVKKRVISRQIMLGIKAFIRYIFFVFLVGACGYTVHYVWIDRELIMKDRVSGAILLQCFYAV